MRKNRKRSFNKGEKGQFLIEAILIMFIFVSISSLVMSGLRESNFIGNLVGSPWGQISGMMSSGHWESFESARESEKLPHQRATSRQSDGPPGSP